MDLESPNQIAPVLLHFLNILKLEILQSTCSHILKIEQKDGIGFLPFYSDVGYNESLMILAQLNRSGNSTGRPGLGAPSQKFCTVCSLVLYSVSHLPSSDLSADSTAWPGSPHHDYHVFIVKGTNIKSWRGITGFGRKLKNAYFLGVHQDSLQMWRPSYNGQTLVYRTTINLKLDKNIDVLHENIRNGSPDFKRNPLVSNTCAVCGVVAYGVFRETGVWLNEWDAIAYYLSVAVNATIDYQPIGALPAFEPDADGEWDDWVGPLLDGSAAIAGFQPFSIVRLQTFYYSPPVYYDYIIFVTAKPKRIREMEVFARLLSPLGWAVWIGSLISVALLFITLEIIIRFVRMLGRHQVSCEESPGKTMNSYSLHNRGHYLSLDEILRPILGQGGNSPTFEKDTRSNWRARLLLSLWFLVLNVIRRGYQNAMITYIVAPEHTKPPTTFSELADSGYHIHALFWTGLIENEFQQSTAEYSKTILNSVEELSYFNPDCFVFVQRSKSACLSLRVWATLVGYEYSVDTKGQLLYQVSKEQIVPNAGSYAISKQFVSIFDTLGNIVRGVHNGGLIQHWAANLELDNIHDGRQFAQTMKSNVEAYGGKAKELKDHAISIMLLNVWFAGFSVALVTLIYEILSSSYSKFRRCHKFQRGAQSDTAGVEHIEVDAFTEVKSETKDAENDFDHEETNERMDDAHHKTEERETTSLTYFGDPEI